METHEVWLETSWAALYHDLVAEGLHLVRKSVQLRTQMKNQLRESGRFGPPPPRTLDQPAITLHYSGHNVARQPNRTILEAMLGAANMNLSYDRADFRLPIPPEWSLKLFEITKTWNIGKPLLVYRPLVVRPEWRGNEKRNADADAYAQLFASIRDRFFVVSVADLEPGREWVVGPQLKDADVTFHKGELYFELLAALFNQAAMVYTSSGFATLLAQATCTANVSVIGLYERGDHHAAGAKYAPTLCIEPANPCSCQQSFCPRRCSKTIDMPVALTALKKFVDDLGVPDVPARSVAEMFDPPIVDPRNRAMHPRQVLNRFQPPGERA